MSDFEVMDDGSIVILTPVSSEATDFSKYAFGKETLMFGNGYCIEPRYLDGILNDLDMRGFVFEYR